MTGVKKLSVKEKIRVTHEGTQCPYQWLKAEVRASQQRDRIQAYNNTDPEQIKQYNHIFGSYPGSAAVPGCLS